MIEAFEHLHRWLQRSNCNTTTPTVLVTFETFGEREKAMYALKQDTKDLVFTEYTDSAQRHNYEGSVLGIKFRLGYRIR